AARQAARRSGRELRLNRGRGPLFAAPDPPTPRDYPPAPAIVWPGAATQLWICDRGLLVLWRSTRRHPPDDRSVATKICLNWQLLQDQSPANGVIRLVS